MSPLAATAQSIEPRRGTSLAPETKKSLRKKSPFKQRER